MIAAGMIGSAQGWIEAPYVDTPADANALVAGIVTVTAARGVTVRVVPGVLERGVLPNVMRGEETQIVGALSADASLSTPGGALIGLPGTHAKWAFVEDGRIERFYTFMTGETFSALRDHTILGRTMQQGAAPMQRRSSAVSILRAMPVIPACSRPSSARARSDSPGN